jgi:DNA-binding transcriptional LysR family regulator
MTLFDLRIIIEDTPSLSVDYEQSDGPLDAMRVFTRVVERRSFTLAAQDTGLPRSTVTDAVKQLEARLGVRLLQRTTRHVSPTLDGEAYYRRCTVLLSDLEEAEGAFAGATPRGVLRVEVQGTLARHFMLPGLPRFFADYPEIELHMSESDRWVDIVREGVDCVLRFGNLPDSDMVARRVALLERLTCAAPEYLERHGTPTDWQGLEGHRMVGIRSMTTGHLRPLDFCVEGVAALRDAADQHVGDGAGELPADGAPGPRDRATAALPYRGGPGARNAGSDAAGVAARADARVDPVPA